MDEHDYSFEPMDVDRSFQSSNGMDISYCESNKEIEDFLKKMNVTIKTEPVDEDIPHSPPPSISLNCNSLSPKSPSIPPISTNGTYIKKFHINIQKEKESPKIRTIIKVICAVLAVIISIPVYQVLNIQCSKDINLELLRQSLVFKLHGQATAIDTLIDGLSENQRSKVLIVYGSTGVGKTYAASTLLEHVGRYSNVYHYTMPSFTNTFTTDLMFGLTVCKNSIVIVDDLNPDDLQVQEHINNLILKTESLKKAVTIILIYNCKPANDFRRHCEEYVPAKIIDHLKEIKANKKMIHFVPLTEEHLRRCIETELGSKKINDKEFTKILKNFDVAVDGCKGVHTKMKHLIL